MSAASEQRLNVTDSRWQRISVAMHAITVAIYLCEAAGLSRAAEQLQILHLEAQVERDRA